MKKQTKAFRIYRVLEEKIKSGEYSHGGYLPPEDKLASLLHAARNTVRKAINLLVKNGMVIKHQGRMSRINFPRNINQDSWRDRIAWFSHSPLAYMDSNFIYFEMFKQIVELGYEENLRVDFYDINAQDCWHNYLSKKDCYVANIAVGIDRELASNILFQELSSLPHLISIDESDDIPGCCCVTIDNFESARLATRYLLDCGYNKIAFINTSNQTRLQFQERLRGFKDVMQEKTGTALNASQTIIVKESRNIRHMEQEFEKVVNERGDIEVFFAATDTIALHLLSAAQRYELRIPEDLAIMGFDGTYAGQHSLPRLTTVAQPIREVVDKALQLALDLERNPQNLPHNIKFISRIIIGETTLPISK